MSRSHKLILTLVMMTLGALACNAPSDEQMMRATDAAAAQATLDALRVTVVPTPTLAPTSVSGFPDITPENVTTLAQARRLTAADQPVGLIAWSRDSALIAAAAGNNVGLVEASTWQQVRVVETDASIQGITLSPNGYLMATVPGIDGRTGALWDTETAQITRTEIGLSGASHVIWSPDGTLLAVARGGGQTELFSMDSGRRLATFIPREAAPDIPADVPSPITGLWFSPNGQRLAASIDTPAYLLIWDLESGEAVNAFEFRHSFRGLTVRAWMSPIWDQFVWITENTLVLAEIDTGLNREALTFEGTVEGFGWSPDGRIIAAATTQTIDGVSTPVVKLIDAGSVQELATLTNNWQEVPHFVLFSPDGTMLAISNDDGSVGVWVAQE